MSLIAAFLLAAAPAAAAPDAGAGSEIVVIARKLKTWRGDLRPADGALACRTKKSSGDRAVDAIGCDAMVACYTPLQPELDSIAAADIGRSEKRRRMTAAMQSAVPCLEQHHDAGVARLAALRAAR